jgi:hypothetical protein
MNTNQQLSNARRAKNDEFYTQLNDIEKEFSHYHYTQHFNDKVVLCNCNDAKYGNFKNYFTSHFKELKLKELICTAYGDNAFYTIYDGNEEHKYELQGDGDFRSKEMIELLNRADIVSTNPPFSLFREYMAQLMEYNKQFLIIGNMNVITYKEVFPLIRDNLIWFGVNTSGHNMTFISDGEKKDVTAVWFTNLEHYKRHKPLELNKEYNPVDYPKYDNYDAIEVSRVANIPKDYDGVMGVPISFLDKYCPNQFEIIGIACGNSWRNYPEILKSLNFNPNMKYGGGLGTTIVNGKATYARILIKRI